MPNILDYLTWRGDVPFSVSPPNEVDNYIHCKIGTLDFTGIVPENELYVPLPQAVEAYFAAGGAEKLGALSSPYIAPMVKRLPETVRFREVMLTGFRQVYDEKKTEQFSALTLRLPGGQHYVTFRGTDDTIVGWKEDCLLTVMDEIPAQCGRVSHMGGLGLSGKNRRRRPFQGRQSRHVRCRHGARERAGAHREHLQ